MALKIENVRSTVTGVQVKFSTSDHRTFWMILDTEGLGFFDRQSSSGALSGTPVVKSADDVFAWIANENPGGKKKFGERKNLKPNPPQEQAPRAKMPKFKGK